MTDSLEDGSQVFFNQFIEDFQLYSIQLYTILLKKLDTASMNSED